MNYAVLLDVDDKPVSLIKDNVIIWDVFSILIGQQTRDSDLYNIISADTFDDYLLELL